MFPNLTPLDVDVISSATLNFSAPESCASCADCWCWLWVASVEGSVWKNHFRGCLSDHDTGCSLVPPCGSVEAGADGFILLGSGLTWSRIIEKGEFEVSLDLLRKNRLDRWAGKSFQSGRARTDQLWALRSNGNRGNSKHMNNVGLAYVLKCVLHFDLCERLRTMASFVVF